MSVIAIRSKAVTDQSEVIEVFDMSPLTLRPDPLIFLEQEAAILATSS